MIYLYTWKVQLSFSLWNTKKEGGGGRERFLAGDNGIKIRIPIICCRVKDYSPDGNNYHIFAHYKGCQSVTVLCVVSVSCDKDKTLISHWYVESLRPDVSNTSLVSGVYLGRVRGLLQGATRGYYRIRAGGETRSVSQILVKHIRVLDQPGNKRDRDKHNDDWVVN